MPKKLPEIYSMPLSILGNITDKVQKGDRYRVRIGYDALRLGVPPLPWVDVTPKMLGKTYAEMPTTLQFMRFVGPARYRFSVTVVTTDDDYTFYSGRTKIKSNVLVAYGHTPSEAHAAWCKLYKAGPMPGSQGKSEKAKYANHVLHDNIRHLIEGDRRWLLAYGTSAVADADINKDRCFRINYGGNDRLVIEMTVVAVVDAETLPEAKKLAK